MQHAHIDIADPSQRPRTPGRTLVGLLASIVVATSIATTTGRTQQGFPPVPVPPGNPITVEKTLLGKALFFEEQLSSTGTVSCATCHRMEAGSSDARSFGAKSVHPGIDGLFQTRDDVRGSRGVPANNADGSYRDVRFFGLSEQVTSRRAMPVVFAAFVPEAFWDGRATNDFRDPQTNVVLLPNRASLESQAAIPIVNDVEMAHFGVTWNEVVTRLGSVVPLALARDVPTALAQHVAKGDYKELFRLAFGTSDITPARIAMAIATYERSLVSDQSRVDDFERGNRAALTAEEQRGRQIFGAPQTRCIECHGGPLATDNRFHYTGVSPQAEDLGRFLVTQQGPDRGRMRTPSMRNVALRAPYFHNGSARTLEDVVAFYNRGGDFNAPNKDGRIRPLNLSAADQRAVVAFLRAFTDPRVAAASAPFDRPRLFTESSDVPFFIGSGTAGSGQHVPAFVAYEPASIDRSRLTLALQGGHGGSPALLLIDAFGDAQGKAIAGMTLHLGLSPAFFALDALVLQGTGPGQGYASMPLRLPSDPSLRGKEIYAQWVSQDFGVQALSATEAVRLRIF